MVGVEKPQFGERWYNIEGDENLLSHATEYYKELFGPKPRYDIDNMTLCRPFSEAEIKNALF